MTDIRLGVDFESEKVEIIPKFRMKKPSAKFGIKLSKLIGGGDWF
jgi:hypothetical protein